MIFRAATLLLAILGTNAAHADAQSEKLVRDFVAWVDSAPDWSASVGDVRSEGRNTFAEGMVFTRAAMGVSISVETLRLRDFVETADGSFVASQAEFGGAAIVSDGFEYAIPTARVDAVTVPPSEGISFDPHRLMTFAAQAYSILAQAEFEDLSIPRMTGMTQQSGLDSLTLEYRDVSASGMADGVLEGARAGPIAIRASGSEGDFTFEIDTVASDRTDLDAFAHIFDPARYQDGRGDGVWRPLLSNITYSGISVAGSDGFSLQLDTFALEGIDGRQLEKPFTQIWDKLLDMSIPEDEKADLALDMLRTYSAWRLARMRMDGLSLEVPEESTELSLDELTVSGISSDGVDSLIVNDMRAGSDEGFFLLGTLELGGFVSPDIETLMQFAALESDIDPKMHADVILDTLAAMPRLGHFGLHDVAVGESKSRSVRLDSFTLDFRDWNDIFAGATDMRLAGLHIPRSLLELEPGAIEMLDALGYRNLVLGMALSDRWSPRQGTHDSTLEITLQEAGDLALSYTLNGITADWIVDATAAAASGEDSEDALMAMLRDLSLVRAALAVTDHSLLDRGFAVAAEQQGLDVDGPTYREQMRAALPFILSAAIPPDLVNLLTQPLQDFLAGRQTLVAEIFPDRPISIPDLITAAEGDPMMLPDLLNLTLTSRTPAQ